MRTWRKHTRKESFRELLCLSYYANGASTTKCVTLQKRFTHSVFEVFSKVANVKVSVHNLHNFRPT